MRNEKELLKQWKAELPCIDVVLNIGIFKEMTILLKVFQMDFNYYERAAEILRLLGNPNRLLIVVGLITNDELNVSDLSRLLRVPKSTTLQYLRRLIEFEIVCWEQKGSKIYYKVEDEKVIKAIKALGVL